MTSPQPDVVRAREALATARATRAEYLVALAEGLLTPTDVLEAAAREEGKPLRRILVQQLHMSCKGVGPGTTKRLMAELAARVPGCPPAHRVTVAWLLDPRAGGRRFLAWLDIQQPKSAPPWPGFPLAARPQ
ncbi:MAG: hypothetical protein ACRCYU_23465 [Nocardioides sp.]